MHDERHPRTVGDRPCARTGAVRLLPARNVDRQTANAARGRADRALILDPAGARADERGASGEARALSARQGPLEPRSTKLAPLGGNGACSGAPAVYARTSIGGGDGGCERRVGDQPNARLSPLDDSWVVIVAARRQSDTQRPPMVRDRAFVHAIHES